MSVLSIHQCIPSVSYCIWQITEAEGFFWERLQLHPEDEAAIRQLKLPSRRLERLACRAALAQLLPSTPLHISYLPNGRPVMEGHHLSFSHCKELSAAAIAPFPVGIDIEPISERILKLYSRIVNQQEMKYFDISNPTHLHLCWGAKEAIYKYLPQLPSDYLNDITLIGNPSDPQLTGQVKTPDGILFTHIYPSIIQDNMVVICTPDKLETKP